MRASQQARCSGEAISAAAGSLDQEIERLGTLDLDQLRVQFRNRTGRIAPARLLRSLLLRVLAYRIQAEALGDLRPETRRLLDKLGASEAAGSEPQGKAAVVAAVARPKRGTVMAREWQGRMEHVMVLDDGYVWSGRTYPSLSAVAGAITGTKWNGRRFFGLDRQDGEKPARPARQRAAGLASGPSQVAANR